MTYQPKRVSKMADFETLTLCICLNSSTYFVRSELQARVCRGKISITILG